MGLIGHIATALLSVTFALAPVALSPAALTERPCADSGTTNPTGLVGELFLPVGATPYSRITITRHMLAPGQTMPTVSDMSVMYIVESGELHYPAQDWTGVYLRPSCVPFVAYNMAIADSGHNSSGGTIVISEADQIRVTAGQTLVAEHGLFGPLSNERTTPLVFLEVTMKSPELDPASGLPIVDQTTADRELNREFALRKQECRERLRALARGNTTSYLPVYLESPEPTFDFTTADWIRAGAPEQPRVPQACDGQNAP